MDMYYVDGVCGSFKTTSGIEFAIMAATQLRQCILFVQPTSRLITQSIANATRISKKVKVERFDTESHPGKVVAELCKFMSGWRGEDHGGCIVFITHKCLMSVPFWPHKEQWNIIVDEAIDVDFEYHLNLPQSCGYAIQPILDATECGLNNILKLGIRNDHCREAEEWARNKGGDDVIAVVQPLFQELTNKHSNVYITRSSWRRLGWDGHGQIDVHGWRSPSILDGWQSARVLSAFFDQSLMYLIWSQMGVSFKPDQQIKLEAPRHNEELGTRVSIHYFSEKNWSKALRNKIAKEDDRLAEIKPIMKDLFGDQRFIWAANNDIPDTTIDIEFPLATRVPCICHGLNDYRHISNAAFLSALNNTPSHFKYMDKVLGISADRLRQAKANQVAYQSIMRTSLREAGSSEKVTVLVPDLDMANWLVEVFPGSRLYTAETSAESSVILGEPKKKRGCPTKMSVLSPAERNKRSKQKKKEIMVTKNTIYKAFFVTTGDHELSHEASVYSTNVHRNKYTGWDDIKDQLYVYHLTLCPKKEDNVLVSGALFNRSKSAETNKGLANIVAVNGIWLDIDGGYLKPVEIEKVFSDVRWVMFNSFNNGKDGHTKYRILLPTTEPMSADIYHAVWDVIADRIRNFGYYVGPTATYNKRIASGLPTPPQSGLDYSKRTASSFFYLPCRALLGGKFTFWRENWGSDITLLNPETWVDYAPLVEQQFETRPAHQNPCSASLAKLRALLDREDHDNVDAGQVVDMKSASVGAAIADWRSTPRGSGHDGFYRLACRLNVTGIVGAELIQMLNTEAAFAHSSEDRRGEIRGIIKSLRTFTARPRSPGTSALLTSTPGNDDHHLRGVRSEADSVSPPSLGAKQQRAA